MIPLFKKQSTLSKRNYRHYPIVDMNRLKSIWEKLECKCNEGEKKRKPHQNYFVVTRKVITDKNPNLKFGEISIIFLRENTMPKKRKI